MVYCWLFILSLPASLGLSAPCETESAEQFAHQQLIFIMGDPGAQSVRALLHVEAALTSGKLSQKDPIVRQLSPYLKELASLRQIEAYLRKDQAEFAKISLEKATRSGERPDPELFQLAKETLSAERNRAAKIVADIHHHVCNALGTLPEQQSVTLSLVAQGTNREDVSLLVRFYEKAIGKNPALKIESLTVEGKKAQIRVTGRGAWSLLASEAGLHSFVVKEDKVFTRGVRVFALPESSPDLPTLRAQQEADPARRRVYHLDHSTISESKTDAADVEAIRRDPEIFLRFIENGRLARGEAKLHELENLSSTGQ